MTLSMPQSKSKTFLGMPIHRKIRTGDKEVPWSVMIMLAVMWFNWGFNLFSGGMALTFTIQKFNKDPQVIALIGSIGGFLMLAPLISYLSDQIWTRAGRRRPFLLIAWAGGLLAMTAYGFFPEVAGAINQILISLGLFPIGEIYILAAIIFVSSKMLDGLSPLEPLFLECVPPHQRGRFWAIRGMMVTLAVTLFFQVLWPNFDVPVDMFAWAGHPGFWVMTGEQMIYRFAATLWLLTGLILVFCIEERRSEQAPNKSFRTMFLGEANSTGSGNDPRSTTVLGWLKTIPIVTFITSFSKDVFLTELSQIG